MSDDPFYFIKEMNRTRNLPEKVDLLTDVLNSVILQIARISEYIDTQIMLVFENVNRSSSRIDAIEHKLGQLEGRVNALNAHTVQQIEVQQPELRRVETSLPPPPPKKTTATDLRSSIMIELKDVFARRRIEQEE